MVVSNLCLLRSAKSELPFSRDHQSKAEVGFQSGRGRMVIQTSGNSYTLDQVCWEKGQVQFSWLLPRFPL